MNAVFESVLPIFALIITGFALRKAEIFPAERWQAIEEVCFWLFFPSLLILTLARSDLRSMSLESIGLTVVAASATIILLVLLLRPLLSYRFGVSGPAFTTIFQTSTRWHAFIALAIILKLHGEAGVAITAVVMALLVPFLNVLNILVVAAYAAGKRPPWRQTAKTIAINPIIWGCLIGLALNAFSVPLWEPVVTYLDLLGRAALGASLLVMGAGLSFKAAMNSSSEVLVGVIIKLAVTPAVTAAYGLYFGLTSLELAVLLICAAVPTAMNGYIIARKMGGDAELYASTSTIQTVLSFATIPLVIWLGTFLVR